MMVVLSIGLLILAQQSGFVGKLLSPGAITLHHSETGDCGTCHDAFDAGPAGWLHAAFAPVNRAADPGADAKKCLACHELGDTPFGPHSLGAGKLGDLTREIVARRPLPPRPAGLTAAGALFGKTPKASGGLGCTDCHKEHRGPEFDQTRMSNGRCQSCHAVQFVSFASGHPTFDAYPFTRRTRIQFNHDSHYRRNFAKENPNKAPKTCTDCHAPTADGRFMAAGGFAETCAACHRDDIDGADLMGAKGIPVLAVPGLDLETLASRGAAIGAWPDGLEAEPTPFMRLLLAADPAFAADMERLDKLDSLLDLQDSSDADIAAVERLAWGVKDLVYRMTVSGVAGLDAPVSQAFGQKVDAVALRRLFGVVPLDVMRAAQVAWFPNLADELARTRRGERVAIPGMTPDDEAAEAAGSESDGASEPENDDILSGDEDDDILSDKEDEEADDILSGDEEDDILSNDEEDDILADDEEDDILSGDEEDDILSGDEEDDILSGDEEDDILSGDEEDDILSDDQEDDDILAEGEGEDGDASDQAAAADAVEVEVAAAMPEPDAETWAALGGWYRRDFALYYKPLGHADRFVRTWLDLSGGAPDTPRQPIAETVFAALTADAAPGRCTKCHSVDQAGAGALAVKWKPRRPEPGTKAATEFSHGTHFSMLDEKGCLTCHARVPDAKFADGYNDHDPLTFASNFAPIDRNICAECHTSGRAGDSCLLCHNYHIGDFPTHPVRTQLQ